MSIMSLKYDKTLNANTKFKNLMYVLTDNTKKWKMAFENS